MFLVLFSSKSDGLAPPTRAATLRGILAPPRRRPLAACAAPLAAALLIAAGAGASRAQQPARGEALEPEIRVARRWDGEPYRLYRWSIPLERTDIEVVDVGMQRDLVRYVRGGASLVINGGFYGTDRRPEGLVVAGGREVNPFLPRIGGGVFAVRDGRASLHDAEAHPLALPDLMDFAVQCRPRLVVDGRNNIARRLPATAARTALCVREGGRGLDVYVARREPSRGRAGPTLHTLAEELVREGCEQALNLDGGPSTGVAWRGRRGLRARPPRRGVRHAIAFTVRPASRTAAE